MRLRQARHDAGFTLEATAQALGTDYNTIWRYEAGRHRPSGPALYALATIYGRPVEWFFGEDDPQTNGGGPQSRAPVTVPEPYLVPSSDYKEFTEGLVTAIQEYLRRRDQAQVTPTGESEDIERLEEVAAAAGVGAQTYDETIKGRVPFLTSWLRRHQIRPANCNIISVRDESMEPTLPGGCSVIVDRSRREPFEDRIYVMRIDEGVVVKRLGIDDDGHWEARSDNHNWSPIPLRYGAEIIGEVRWYGVTL